MALVTQQPPSPAFVWTTGAAADTFLHTHLQGAQQLLANCVQAGSHDRYLSGWRKWCMFIYMCFSYTSESNLFPDSTSGTPLVRLLAAFIHYAATTLRLAPSTVTQTMSAIKHFFRLHCSDTAPFANPALAACKTAVRLEAARDPNRPPSRRKLPFSHEMTMEAYNFHCAEGTLRGLMLATAIMLAFTCLFRASEYIARVRRVVAAILPHLTSPPQETLWHGPTSTAPPPCHALRAADVQFWIRGATGSITINAAQVAGVAWASVILVKITLQSNKTDKFRAGRLLYYSARRSLRGVDIALVLFTWAQAAALNPQDLLFSLPGSARRRVPLTYDAMRTTLTNCVSRFALPLSQFSTHSLRIGGACALRASGASDSMIMFMGRWKTLPAALGYLEVSLSEFDHAMELVSQPGVLSTDEIRLIFNRAAMVESASPADLTDDESVEDDVEDEPLG